MKKRDEERIVALLREIRAMERQWKDPIWALAKPILVGEANPYGGDRSNALLPYPDGSAGHRLCVKILGMVRAEYLRDFDRVNLCGQTWSLKLARRRAEELKAEGRPLVFLGAKVCQAFGVEFEPFEAGPFAALAQDGRPYRFKYLVLPHPSGLCRLWNKDGAFDRARAAVQQLREHPFA